ncbi:related to cellulose binding protein CEL1 [Cephalotrichum gorgonifer]|uniref:lytic cellulose monooxygenase (C4-dehydrogenating) n=1 Tax=Cephalotrichum gorgonifer TaxID=2041049 RepID=A0AAE8SZT1_9PEZI|nr:related to cellulose binding protein CEL1 [Cephalotrichum gorgonifer]
MKSFLGVAAALTLLAGEASAHYIFQQISVAGKQYGIFEGVRKHTNGNSPVIDLSSSDLACNKGAIASTDTIVLDAKAGDEIVFSLDTAVYHQGPLSIHMSRAPGSVQGYDGSDGWRKLYDIGPSFTGGQATWPLSQKYSWKLPTCLPDGEYLLRIQNLGIHNPYPAGIPQFYISCAQLKITGGSGSADSWEQPLQIPGVFKESDPGYTANIYDPNFKSYVVPGGEVNPESTPRFQLRPPHPSTGNLRVTSTCTSTNTAIESHGHHTSQYIRTDGRLCAPLWLVPHHDATTLCDSTRTVNGADIPDDAILAHGLDGSTAF